MSYATEGDYMLDDKLDKLGEQYFEYHPVGTTGEWRRFKQAISALIDEARIEELEKQTNLYLPGEYSDHYRNGFHSAINQMEQSKEKRIKELKAKLTKEKK